jgi:hypothetical protein
MKNKMPIVVLFLLFNGRCEDGPGGKFVALRNGYTGIDYVEIKTCRGGEGTGYSEISAVGIRFSIIP